MSRGAAVQQRQRKRAGSILSSQEQLPVREGKGKEVHAGAKCIQAFSPPGSGLGTGAPDVGSRGRDSLFLQHGAGKAALPGGTGRLSQHRLPPVSSSLPCSPSSLPGHREGKNTHLEVTQYQWKGGNKDRPDVAAWTHLGFSLTQRSSSSSSSSPSCSLLQSKDLLCAGVLQTSLVIFSTPSLELPGASRLPRPAPAGASAAGGGLGTGSRAQTQSLLT